MTTTTEPTDREVLDANQTGALIGCSGRHVQNLVARGEFPAPVSLGRLKRWPRSVVLAWLHERCGPAVNRAGRAVQVRG